MPDQFSKEELEVGIRDVLASIAAGLDAEDHAAYRAVRDTPALRAAREAIDRRDLTGFRFALQRSIEKVVDGLLLEVAPDSAEARYLIKRASYVERHFRAVIQQAEGSSCCADKSRTLVAALLSHFLEGKPIQFERADRYTFHLTERVFLDQEAILGFFAAVRMLDHGDPRTYLMRPELQAFKDS